LVIIAQATNAQAAASATPPAMFQAALNPRVQ